MTVTPTTMLASRTPAPPKWYYLANLAFIASLTLLLLTIVDIRRGFLFSGYFKVGAPSALLNLSPLHLALLLVAGIGVWLSYRYIKRLETDLKERVDLKTVTRILAIVIGVLLVIDLFIYRGVPASRFLAGGTMGAGPGPLGMGRAIPIASFPTWLQPAGEGVNYLLTVWHATVLGMLLSSLFLVAGTGIITRLKGNGFGAHVTASGMSLAQPFCSCCAAPIGSTLYRKGAALGPMLAFTVSAPMLNITSLILAAAFLPASFAALRIAGGIIIGIFVTYAVARMTARWVATTEPEAKTNSKLHSWTSRVLVTYNRLFRFENLFSEAATDSPAALILNWPGMAWKLAKILVPILLVGSILAAYIVQVMPPAIDTVASVIVTAIFATLLMVPTWTEIPLAAGLINGGLPGTAAAALIALPAVSLPCLAIIAGAVRSWKIAVTLGLTVLAAATIAGLLFL